MNEERAKKVLQDQIEKYGQEYDAEGIEALEMAINALEQESITWIVGKDNCQVAVKNMPIDKMQKICAIIRDEEQQPHKAEFVPSRDGYEGHVTCSNCFKIYDWDSEAQYFNYCPNCGADMRGDMNDR